MKGLRLDPLPLEPLLRREPPEEAEPGFASYVPQALAAALSQQDLELSQSGDGFWTLRLKRR